MSFNKSVPENRPFRSFQIGDYIACFRYEVLPLVTLLSAFLLAYTAEISLAQAGQLDPGFGDQGKVVTNLEGQNDDVVHDAAVQPDGKIVVIGFTRNSGSDFALARYRTDGSLDPTFGDGGKVTTDLGAVDMGNSIALQDDGKIVAGGRSGDNFALVRYRSDGSLDPDFGSNGTVTTDFGDWDWINSLAVQNDGKIVAGGQTGGIASSDDFALARYHPDGSLDMRFGDDGKVTTHFGAIEWVNDLVVQPDGRIVAVGGTIESKFDTGSGLVLVFDEFALARYDTDGTLDESFGSGGTATTDFEDLATANDLVIGPDGTMAAAGHVNFSDFALARYENDGSLDMDFSGDGKVTTNFSDFEAAYAVDLQSNGKIVAAGFTDPGSTGWDFALARYLTDTGETPDRPTVTGFELVSRCSTTGQPIEDGKEFKLWELLPRETTVRSIRAVTHPSEMGSVKFIVNGEEVRIENEPPYALSGDNDGCYRRWVPDPGTYTLTAIPYSGRNAAGEEGTPRTIAFTILALEDLPGPAITGFNLINAETDEVIRPLEDGDQIDLRELPTRNLNIQALADEVVGRVEFFLDGTLVQRERARPFALGGDNRGNYRWMSLEPGEHTLKIVPYPIQEEPSLAGEEVTITFTVVDGEASNQLAEKTFDRSAASAYMPENFALDGNYPNPFNPTTTIVFDLPERAQVTVQVVDMLGRIVMETPRQTLEAGAQRTVSLDASHLNSGVYLYRLTAQMPAQTAVEIGRLTLIK